MLSAASRHPIVWNKAVVILTQPFAGLGWRAMDAGTTIHIWQRFKKENIRSKMILQVHDELNFSVYPDEKEIVEKIVLEEVELFHIFMCFEV